MKIGIVGAGAAGLCAARHFSKSADFKCEITVLEQQGHVGGTWKHTSQVGTDENGFRVHSSMYDNLRTNLPKQVMEYPDFPFSDVNGDSYIYHNEVQEYLEDYATYFELEKHIRFFRKVEKIHPLPSENRFGVIWRVDATNLKDKCQEKYVFDALILASGSYTYPRIPSIPGIDKFEGNVIHSHDYRNNENFKDKNVLVLGAGPSGVDISLELSDVCQKVILCHSNVPIFEEKDTPERLKEKTPLTSLNEHSAIFSDGTEIKIDVLMLCTGYDPKFNELLNSEIKINLEERRASPLYKHYISVNHTNLAVFGLTFRVIPFPLYHLQALALTKFWSGKVSLPSKEDMLADEKKDFEKRIKLGMPVRYAHILKGDFQFDYFDSLAEVSSIPKLPPIYKKLYDYSHFLRKTNPIGYKSVRIKIQDIL